MQALKNHPLDTPDHARTETDCTGELPVLSAVVRTGNASIIQSHRLGHQVLDELETLRLVPGPPLQEQAPHTRQVIPDRFSLLDDLAYSFDETIEFEQPDFAPGLDASFARRDTEATVSDDELELMVEALVDRHVNELRRDIRSLLVRARQIR